MFVRIAKLRRNMRARSRSGSAAVEFAFVAIPFFTLLSGILEGGIMFFGQAALSNSVQNAARAIRVGQAPANRQGFENSVCNGIDFILTCTGALSANVQAFPNGFSSGTPPVPFDSAGEPINGYASGAACNVVIARAYYKYTPMTPGLNFMLNGNSGKSYTYLTAAAAFRNEPFGADAC